MGRDTSFLRLSSSTGIKEHRFLFLESNPYPVHQRNDFFF
jgi:hypothetical protein